METNKSAEIEKATILNWSFEMRRYFSLSFSLCRELVKGNDCGREKCGRLPEWGRRCGLSGLSTNLLHSIIVYVFGIVFLQNIISIKVILDTIKHLLEYDGYQATNV